MSNQPQYKHVQFENRNHPNLGFEIIDFEELQSREIEFPITEFHIVEFYHFIVITHGTGFHTIDFTDHNFEKGTVLAIRKDQIQKFFKNHEAKGYILIFTEAFLETCFTRPEVLKSLRLFNELLVHPKTVLAPQQLDELLVFIREIKYEYERTPDLYSVDIMRSALHMIIIKTLRAKNAEKERLRNRHIATFLKFQTLIETHYVQYRKVSDFAGMMSYTTKTLNNISREVIGKSAKQIIDEIVITNIKRLLLNTSLSIKEIAYQTGFEETTNIYKYFKKHVGTSPEKFRATYA